MIVYGKGEFEVKIWEQGDYPPAVIRNAVEHNVISKKAANEKVWSDRTILMMHNWRAGRTKYQLMAACNQMSLF